MKLCIDGLGYFLHEGELGEHSKYLIHALAEDKYILLHLLKDINICSSKNNDLKLKATIASLNLNRDLDDYKSLINYLDYNNIKVYHCLNNGFSLSKNMGHRNVITSFNNIIPLEYEDFYKKEYTDKFFKSLPITLEVTNKFICPSYSFKEMFINTCNVDADKVYVIPPILPSKYEVLNKYITSVYLRSKFNVTEEFILISGDFHKRKRFDLVLEAFLRVSQEKENIILIFLIKINKLNIDYFNEIKELINILNLYNKIRFITNFTEDDKVYFYNGAYCYLDLSIYESLNISLSESYMCKCKTICSDIDGNREALRNTGIFLDLSTEDSINIITESIFKIGEIDIYDDNFYEENKVYYNKNEILNSLKEIYGL